MGSEGTTSQEEKFGAPLQAPQRPDRRGFLVKLLTGWIGLVASALLMGWDLLRYVAPPSKVEGRRKVFVARLPELPEGEAHSMADLRGKPVAILRLPGEAPIALSLICTHLGCRVHWQPQERTFLCPCHMGIFDARGKVLSGPPPRPLPSYEVSVEAENVYVSLPEA